MSGSMDDHKVEVINVAEETLLALIVEPSGRVRMQSDPRVDKPWIIETLRRVLTALEEE